jgi:hypothetical protein
VKPKSHGRVKLRAKRQRHRRGLWKLSMRASGEGSGVVIVRCRNRRQGQVRTVLHRSVRLPRSLHGKVRCAATRPRAKLLLSN